MKPENVYKKKLIVKIKKMFPSIIVVLNESKLSVRGIPDIFLFYKTKSAALEVKKDKASLKSNRTALQEHFLNKLTETGIFACFIYPENEEFVLKTLNEYFYGLLEKQIAS